MKYFLKKKEILISILFILFFKLYYLFLFPIEHGFVTSYSANTLIFYNSKSFLLKAQSFNDWNHPGTPIYYFVFLISKIIGGLDYENFSKFVYAHNLFTFLLYLTSINYFFNYFKRYISNLTLLLSFIFFNSFYMSLHTLEFIDPTNYLLPLAMILSVQTFKILTKKINFISISKFSLVLILALFTKLSFLPFVISSIVVFFLRIFHEFKIKISFFRLLQFISISFIFTLLWNFPIIGRIPKILYAAVFTRNDTLLNVNVLIEFFNNFFTFYLDKKVFFLILVIILIIYCTIFYLKFIIKVITSKFETKNKGDLYIFVFGLLLFLSFNYTLLNTAREYKLFSNEPGIGDLLRNCFLYSLFIIPVLIFSNSNKKYVYFLKILIILAFFNNLYFYENNRTKAKKNLELHEKIFYEKTDKYLKNRTYAIFNTGYPNTSLILHHIGNNIFAGERFTEELNRSNPNLRFLRVADIYNEMSHQNNFSKNNTFFKKKMAQIDKIFKENLNRNLYLILSPNSFRETSNFIGFKNRKKDLYLSQKKVDYIVFNSSNKFFLNRNINIEKFVNFLSTKKNFKKENIAVINILNDKWYIIKLDK